ncbi:MAG: pyruvate flavodoxin/ferredoxin oxidoreductase domain protein [Acidobacteria bacterium]|nr:pyruvate flavodoxin/ferredoxin oxidoreductase domain protein [Acidobacteriota bacterium]
MNTDLVIGMAGSGGDGIVAAGESLLTAAALVGYHGVLTKSFGPQIRGGESSFRLRLCTEKVLNPGGSLDIAVALNWEDFLKFGAELPVGGQTTVVYDSNTNVAPDKLPLVGVTPAEVIPVPVEQMARETGGSDRAKNTVVLGLMSGWLGIGREEVIAGIRKRLSKKGAEIVERAEKAFHAGLEYAEQHPLKTNRVMAEPSAPTAKFVVDGNDLCAAAAIVAGCDFFSGYPITPSSEIMHFLGREIWKYGGTMLQAEDEIAGVGAVVGASFAGKKAMTATSGPGMSLKTEMLGLASIAELPLVCVNVQRGGPSTGIPTKGEQSDLFQAAFSAHGDVIRPVLAPVSAEDMFPITIEAFNLAEHYQTPVIILSDQEVGQRKETAEPIDANAIRIIDRRKPNEKELEHYTRFRFTETGISPISHPGMKGGNYLASGIEHNEQGAPTAGGEMHGRMNDKRLKKFNPLKQRRDLFIVEGSADAPLGLISWGSVAGTAIEAFHMAVKQGLRVKLLVPRLLYPVSEAVYQEFFASIKRGLVVEQNHQSQLFRLLRMFVDVPGGIETLAKSGSNPITPGEVADRLRQISLALQREKHQEPSQG